MAPDSTALVTIPRPPPEFFVEPFLLVCPLASACRDRNGRSLEVSSTGRNVNEAFKILFGPQQDDSFVYRLFGTTCPGSYLSWRPNKCSVIMISNLRGLYVVGPQGPAITERRVKDWGKPEATG